MPTIEERARKMLNATYREYGGVGSPVWAKRDKRQSDYIVEAFCREIEAHDAERAAHAQFRQEVSDVARDALAMLDEMAKALLMGWAVKERLKKARGGLEPLIIAKPVDPLVEVFREVRKYSAQEGEEWADAVVRRARDAAAELGYELKLVEVGDAD